MKAGLACQLSGESGTGAHLDLRNLFWFMPHTLLRVQPHSRELATPKTTDTHCLGSWPCTGWPWYTLGKQHVWFVNNSHLKGMQVEPGCSFCRFVVGGKGYVQQQGWPTALARTTPCVCWVCMHAPMRAWPPCIMIMHLLCV